MSAFVRTFILRRAFVVFIVALAAGCSGSGSDAGDSVVSAEVNSVEGVVNATNDEPSVEANVNSNAPDDVVNNVPSPTVPAVPVDDASASNTPIVDAPVNAVAVNDAPVINTPVDNAPADNNPADDIQSADASVTDNSVLTPPETSSPTVSNPFAPNNDGPANTEVTFNIVVPPYVSDALQVRVVWGEAVTTAAWVIDETWQATAVLPTGTTHRLSVTFSDDNGITPLGSYEASYTTGTSDSESIDITANQFDVKRWDADGDGVPNIEETAEPPTPVVAEPPSTSPDITLSVPQSDPGANLLPVQARVELVADKTFRIRWEPTAAADYYRVLENPDGVSGYSPVSDQLPPSTDQFDHRVALHKRVNARYMVEACNASGCTLSVQQLIESTLDDAIGYFKSSNPEYFDQFGMSVSISGDGNTLAVGAPQEDSASAGVNGDQSDNSIKDAGAAYVFVRRNAGWVQQAYIKASNPEERAYFGAALDLSADGNTLAVGASDEDGSAVGINAEPNPRERLNAGAVYVYVRSGDAWAQQAYIKASNVDQEAPACCASGAGYLFGENLSISADGNTLAVGAAGEARGDIGINGDKNNESGVTSGAGAVYVFVRDGVNWQQQAHITAASPHDTRQFGRSLGLSADGSTLAVGLYDAGGEPIFFRGASPSPSYYYGAAYVYTRSGSHWTPEAQLRNISGELSAYGWSLSLSGDGNTIAVATVGGVDIHERTGGVWSAQTFLDGYRFSLALSDDGNTLVTANSAESSASTGVGGYSGLEIAKKNSGAVHVHIRRDGVWLSPVYVKASNTDTDDRFGAATAVSSDGNTLVAGAFGEDGNSAGFNGYQPSSEESGNYGTGAVYLY